MICNVALENKGRFVWSKAVFNKWKNHLFFWFREIDNFSYLRLKYWLNSTSYNSVSNRWYCVSTMLFWLMGSNQLLNGVWGGECVSHKQALLVRSSLQVVAGGLASKISLQIGGSWAACYCSWPGPAGHHVWPLSSGGLGPTNHLAGKLPAASTLRRRATPGAVYLVRPPWHPAPTGPGKWPHMWRCRGWSQTWPPPSWASVKWQISGSWGSGTASWLVEMSGNGTSCCLLHGLSQICAGACQRPMQGELWFVHPRQSFEEDVKEGRQLVRDTWGREWGMAGGSGAK